MDRAKFASWVSEEAKALFLRYTQQPPAPTDIIGARAFYNAFNQRHLDVALGQYDVEIVEGEIGGVVIQTVTPASGTKRDGVLICLHGGGFMWGSGAGALLEAVPIAAATGMKVVAVNYRLAPEHVYPAAVEDVMTVYKALLAQTDAKSIGVYGCSAGGALTAQTVARLINDDAALPGAIGMFHGTGLEMAGDSTLLASALDASDGQALAPELGDFPYFANADLSDPLVLPGNHTDMLAQFPPSLLITGTRDFAASSVSVMHRRLLAAGATSSFVNFDGMWHAHHMAVDMPESRETFDLVARFFETHLG